jgi:hypothetical protein
MVRLSTVARDDSAPRNPVTVTVRPASDRLSSRKAGQPVAIILCQRGQGQGDQGGKDKRAHQKACPMPT